jgi:signal transduction histidine kinase
MLMMETRKARWLSKREEPMPTATSTPRRPIPGLRRPVEWSEPETTNDWKGEGTHIPSQLRSERTRIAREIHDVLAHSLSALGVQIETARSVLADRGDISQAISLLEHASHLADDGLSETREAIHALRADPPPLPDALAGLVDAHHRDYRHPVFLSITGPSRPIRVNTNVALIRAAQEALTNAARHAPSAAVTIDLHYGPEQITLTVANAAQPPATCASRGGDGFGLAGMRERLQLAGGTLTTERAGDEWVVRAQVPQ